VVAINSDSAAAFGHVGTHLCFIPSSPLTMSPTKSWRTLPLLLLVSITSVFASSQSFENTAIVRTVELGGSVVHVTTTYAIKALEDGVKTYTVALGRDEKSKTSWLEARIKGQKEALQVKERFFDVGKYVSLQSFSSVRAN